MQFIPLKATKRTIDVKKGGAITYETETVTDGPGIILLDNETGEYGVVLVSQMHKGGKVSVIMKAAVVPAKAYEVGDIVAQLALF